MLLVFLVIGIAIIVGGVLITQNYDDFVGVGVGIFGTIFLVITFVIMACCLVDVTSVPALKQEIAMYESENAMIEQQVEEVVKAYQKYESDIFSEVSAGNVMATVTLYPELKSNTLVEKQIYVYTSNNAKIKELKSKLLYRNVAAWWVYFGKVVVE